MNKIMQFYQAMQNPAQFIQSISNNNQVMNNPMARRTVEMMKKQDYKGIEEMAKNMCKERGINPNDAINQLKHQMGIQ